CLQQLELKDVILRTGDQLKIKGFVLHDADRFHIDLGNDANELALHFNPRFHDNADGSVLVFNSKTAGCWGEERREIPNPLHRGKEVRDCLRIVVMFCPKMEIPDDHEFKFPNQESVMSSVTSGLVETSTDIFLDLLRDTYMARLFHWRAISLTGFRWLQFHKIFTRTENINHLNFRSLCVSFF
uniref:Galectin n=1 Tax=Takifugu rubripes TaxID=31033 RepID=A0A674MT87_TAKRU